MWLHQLMAYGEGAVGVQRHRREKCAKKSVNGLGASSGYDVSGFGSFFAKGEASVGNLQPDKDKTRLTPKPH